MSSVSVTLTKHVQPGACFKADGSFDHCAFDGTACGSDGSFASSWELHNKGSEFSSGAHCLGNEEKRKIRTGRCESDDDYHLCTSDASACASPDSFKAVDDGCTLTHDETRKMHEIDYGTVFGLCTKTDFEEAFCVWSAESCPSEGYAFLGAGVAAELLASQTHTQQCTCDVVHTGACQRKGDPFGTLTCAVSAAACDSESVYVTAQEVVQREDVDCMLCEVDAFAPLEFTDGNKGAKAGTSMLLLALIGAAVVACVVRRRRRSESSKRIRAAATTNPDASII